MRRIFRSICAVLLICIGIVLLGLLVIRVSFSTSNDRDWVTEQAQLPSAIFEDDVVHVKNIRRNTYGGAGNFDVSYYDADFDLNKLESLWFIVSPFSDWKGAAHTFLSFGFEDGRHLAISVEVRKEQGEKYSLLKGLLRQFELIYVVGDEEDLIRLRTEVYEDDVYLYNVQVPKKHIRKLLVDMLQRANSLGENPEFYNTIANTCTTNIVSHINTIAPKSVGWNPKILMPGYTDRLAYDLGLIDTSLPFDDVREKFLINKKAKQFTGEEDFSRLIRE